MKKYLVTAIALLFVGSYAMAEDIPLNDGFESGQPGEIPQHWQKTNWDTGGRCRTIDTDSYRGSKSVQISGSGKAWQVLHQHLHLEPGARYRLRLRGKTDGTTGGNVQVVSYSPGGSPFKPNEKQRSLGSLSFSPSRWSEYCLEFTAPVDSSEKTCLKLCPSAWRMAGAWIRVDDVIIERIENSATASEQNSNGGYNMLVNGGFEFGLRDWYVAGDSLLGEEYELVSDGAYGGKYCLRRIAGTKPMGIVSNWAPAKPGRKYYVSVALKGESDDQVATLRVSNPDYYHNIKYKWPTWKCKLTKNWRVFKFEHAFPEDVRITRLTLDVNCTGGSFRMDSAYLGYGKPQAEESVRNELVGVAVLSGKVGNIFDYGKAAAITLESRNAGKSPRKLSVEYTVEDLFEKVIVDKGLYKVSLDGNSVEKRIVPIDSNRRGRFKLVVKVKDENGQLIRKTRTGFAVLKEVHSPYDSPLATNILAHRIPTSSLRTTCSLLGKYGMKWIRLWWIWRLVQPRQGEPFDWTEFDRQIKEVKDAGMEAMPCLLNMYDGGKWTEKSLNTGDWTEWQNFVRAVVSRYKGQIKLWEIWNEPNMNDNPPPKRGLQWYYELVKASYPVAKQADPDCTIIACSTGDNDYTPGYAAGMQHIERFLKLGGVKYCDAIGLHPYCSVDSPIWGRFQKHLDTIRGWIKNSGGKQNVLITEAGPRVSMDGYHSDGDNMSSAASMLQNWIISWQNETKYFHFAATPNHGYCMNLYENGVVPNAIFCAMNVLAEKINGAKFGHWLDIHKSLGGIYGVRFSKGRSQTLMLWVQGNPQKRTLVLDVPGKPTLTNMMGNAVKYSRDNGKLLVPLTRYPCYLTFANISGKQLDSATSAAKEIRGTGTDIGDMVGSTHGGQKWIAGYKPKPEGPFRPDADGFIKDWLLMGPFANAGGRGVSVGFEHDYLECMGGEAKLQLLPGMTVKHQFPNIGEWKGMGMKTIKAVGIHSKTSKIDFRQFMAPRRNVIAYAYCNVTVPRTVKAKLCVGSDDGIKVFLNGSAVISENVYRGAVPDQNIAAVRLLKGTNRLMVKVDQDVVGWAFYLRFLDEAGKPIKNLTVGW